MRKITELFSQLPLQEKIMVHNYMDTEIRLKVQQNCNVVENFYRFFNACTFLKIPNILIFFRSLYNQRHDETAFNKSLGKIRETQSVTINSSELSQELLQLGGYIDYFNENSEALAITRLSSFGIYILLEIQSSLSNQLVQILKIKKYLMEKQSHKFPRKKPVGYERNLPSYPYTL